MGAHGLGAAARCGAEEGREEERRQEDRADAGEARGEAVKKDDHADRLISGKLRGKASRRGAAAKLLTVDGTTFTWERRHAFVIDGKLLHAYSFSVALQPERTRELILDFTLRPEERGVPPSDKRVASMLEDGVRAALEGGWDPESRGRAFRFQLDDGQD
jgi:hypothetical protein